MLKHKLVDFIIQFMEEVDKEISEMKLFVSFAVSQSYCLADYDEVERQSSFCGRVIPDSFRLNYERWKEGYPVSKTILQGSSSQVLAKGPGDGAKARQASSLRTADQLGLLCEVHHYEQR